MWCCTAVELPHFFHIHTRVHSKSAARLRTESTQSLACFTGRLPTVACLKPHAGLLQDLTNTPEMAAMQGP